MEKNHRLSTSRERWKHPVIGYCRTLAAVTALMLLLAACTTAQEAPPVDMGASTTTTLPESKENLDQIPVIGPFTGSVNLTHVSGDAETLPGGYIVSTPTGYISVGFPSFSLYWTSTDGLEWTAAPPPIPIVAEWYEMPPWAQGGAGYYWLYTNGPNSVWRSLDGLTWDNVELPGLAGHTGLRLYEQEGAIWAFTEAPFALWISDDGTLFRPVDISEVMPPDIEGVMWRTWFYPMASTNDATIILVSGDGGITIDWQRWGDPGWNWIEYEWHPSTRSVTARATQWVNEDMRDEMPLPPGYVVANLIVEIDGNRLMIIDTADGTMVGEIVVHDPGIDPASLLDDWGSSGFGSFQRWSMWVLVGSDGVARQINTPWGPGWFDIESDDLLFWVSLLATSDGFMSYRISQHRGAPYEVELWTSSDGFTWSGPDPMVAGFLLDDAHLIRFESFGVFREGDMSVATLGWGDGRHQTYWVSDDGIHWDQVLITSPGARLKKLDSLWVGYSGPQQLYVSSDLHTWQIVDLSEANIPWFNGGTPYASAAGNTLFLLFRGGGEKGRQDLLIVELEP
jgi:hypothetical protein